MKKCLHDKCYAPHVLLSNPPQYPWVCRNCGEKGADVGTYYDFDEYNRLAAGKIEVEYD